MSAPSPFRNLNLGQLVAVLAATLALFFLISFVSKSLQAYRLKTLQASLMVEQGKLMRERDELRKEIERRRSDAWADELLRDAGWVPPGGVRVIPVTATPDPLSKPTPQPSPTPGEISTLRLPTLGGSQWRAWAQLIWGFD